MVKHCCCGGNGSGTNDPLPLNQIYADLAYSENEVLKTDGIIVSAEDKGKALHKFGSSINLVANVEKTIWGNSGAGFEVFLSANLIDTISTDDIGNTQTVVIEGHTIDGSGNFTFVVQTVTLNGLIKVVLPIPLARVSRVANDDSFDFVTGSSLYIYEEQAILLGVPQTPSKVHMEFLGNGNQSLKCSTTFSQTDYAFLTSLSGSVEKNNSANVDFFLNVREKGKVFRRIYLWSATNTSGVREEILIPYIVIRPNSDVYISALSSTNAVDVSASMDFIIASIVL